VPIVTTANNTTPCVINPPLPYYKGAPVLLKLFFASKQNLSETEFVSLPFCMFNKKCRITFFRFFSLPKFFFSLCFASVFFFLLRYFSFRFVSLPYFSFHFIFCFHIFLFAFFRFRIFLFALFRLYFSFCLVSLPFFCFASK
jgi:hypothetical protein